MSGAQRGVNVAAISALAAAACGTVAFVALRERYRGDCLFLQWNPYPDSSIDTDQVLFNVGLAVAFIACTLWFGASIAPLLARVAGGHASALRSAALGVLFAVIIYIAFVLATWQMNPVPRDADDAPDRWYLSALWPLGILQETGNFSHTLCGE